MARGLQKKLNEILIECRLLKEEDLKKALAIQREKGGQLSRIIVEQGMIKEQDLVICLGENLDMPPINLARFKPDPEVIKMLPEQVARHYQIIPLSKLGGVLSVAMSDPLNVFALDDIKILTKCEVEPIIASSQDIAKAIDTYYGASSNDMSAILEEAKVEEDSEGATGVEVILDKDDTDLAELASVGKQAPIVKMVDLIISEALKKRASDIHIEPYENKLRVRYRIDGNLEEAFILPKKLKNAILARIKIMSNLDITQRRLPQDGRFKVKLDNKEVDFRVSVLPINFGQKVVMRALDKANLSIGLDKLGFLPNTMKIVHEAIRKPYGMILSTGPTGSGKSTTLYSVVNLLNTPERNIITIEEPVEYMVEGITQLQVRQEIGLTFASGLRSLLRQSPDIIMVGEIRDFETADIAVKASLTGQLVLSTLHTNDSAGAVTRLVDMGLEPFLVASSLILVAAQRLARKICPNCKEPVKIPAEVLERVGFNFKAFDKPSFYKGKGCARCNHTGYHGRVAILEPLVINDAIKNMIIERKSSDEIREYGISEGALQTLRQAALENMAIGVTTLEEVLRVT